VRDIVPVPKGRVRTYRVNRVPAISRELVADRMARHELFLPPGWDRLSSWVSNDVLYEWGAIVGRLMTEGLRNYRIGGMYFEFMNVADPDDAVTPPGFTRDAGEGVDYFDGLADDPDRDYLRVPLTAARLDISNEENFPKGNMPVFFAQTTGVTGVHGKAFSDANNSKVYGGALVAFVDKDDATQDLVFSRFYLPTDEQQVKLPTSQIGFEWEISLK
jgi:hypothetical protein